MQTAAGRTANGTPGGPSPVVGGDPAPGKLEDVAGDSPPHGDLRLPA